ncbi:hypothetical protein CAC42_5120 [Sphaceloma murrayae]|uniref:CRIB domain-containing protein n=1 Tax=Sphaceloma murrayae TaxID=2082308 RepID=A0A2K1QU71_9PEZI|nr:hypothetical protein CAC42_5120 [Sphaceloma murrayae]
MAPKWLQFSDEQGKRASVLSAVSSHRRIVCDEIEPFPAALQHAWMDIPTQDSQDAFEAPADRAPSKKRYSLFARSIATTSDGDSDRPSPEPSRHWSRLPFQDKPSEIVDEDDFANDVARKPSRKSGPPRNGRHEPILRWMRRVERSGSTRPSTPFGFGTREDQKDDEDREQKKAIISAPFNFQHVTHTQPRELPQLDLVSDRDLTHTFWASSAQQQPQNDLRGIKAEDINEVQRMSRPGSTFGGESRPGSSSENVNFSRIRSSSLGRETAPRLRASRSLSNASATSTDESRRPSAISRSASLASLIAEPRSPPSMVHPAFRPVPEALPLPQVPMPWALSGSIQPGSSGLQTPPCELNRNLDVVPEETESPRKSATFETLERAAATARRFEKRASAQQEPQQDPHRSMSSIGSDCQDTTTIDMSVPSLSSGETWEEDVDFCYNMEAESTCDFTYGDGSFGSPNPHDSVFAPPYKRLMDTDNQFDVSPRVSIAAHQRNRSSMTMTPFLSSPSKFDITSAFENPRIAPEAPLPEISRLSSLLDLPMLHAPAYDRESAGLGEISKQAATNMQFLQAFQPDDLTKALDRYSSAPSSQHEHYYLAPAYARPMSVADESVRSATPDAKRMSYVAAAPRTSIIKADDAKNIEATSRPISLAQAPSPPPCIPLPPIPKEAQRSIMAAKRATVAATPSEKIIMRRPQTAEDRSLLQAAGRNVQHTRTATPPRLQTGRGVGSPSPHDDMKRSKSSPNVHDLYKAHAIPKMAEKFPVWI